MIPPSNHDLERQALAAVLIDPDVWSTLGELPPAAFHSPAAAELFGVMGSLHAAGLPLDDHALILQHAQQGGRAPSVNLAYLSAVQGVETSAYYAETYAAELRALHARRETMRLAHRLAHHASEGDLSGDELATLASQVALPFASHSRSEFVTHAQAIDAALLDAESLAPNAIGSGFPDLDAVVVGWEPGALYVLGARPAMGKSALGYATILSAAARGHAGAVASLEMPGKALAMRALATEAGVDLNRIRQRTLSPMERQRLRNAGAKLRSLPITFMDTAGQTAQSILRDARKLRATGRLDFLMVDYLQLIESGKASENRQQEISAISRALKKLAMELEVPVLALSQLSRALEMRPSKRPLLSDLRESGAVEQDADTVLFLYRDEYYDRNSADQGVAEVIVAKQRNGPLDTVRLSFSSEFVRFGSVTRGPVSMYAGLS